MRRPHTLGLAALVGSLFVSTISSCSSDQTPNSQAAYCQAVKGNVEMFDAPPTATADDRRRIANLYQDMHAKAPLAVEPEWAVIEALMREAVNVDPKDPAAVAKLSESARLARSASNRIIQYTAQLCKVRLGDSVPVEAAGSTTPTGG